MMHPATCELVGGLECDCHKVCLCSVEVHNAFKVTSHGGPGGAAWCWSAAAAVVDVLLTWCLRVSAGSAPYTIHALWVVAASMA